MNTQEAKKAIADYIAKRNYTYTVADIIHEFIKSETGSYVSYTADDVIKRCRIPLNVIAVDALKEKENRENPQPLALDKLRERATAGESIECPKCGWRYRTNSELAELFAVKPKEDEMDTKQKKQMVETMNRNFEGDNETVNLTFESKPEENKPMRILVYNDGYIVFEGDASVFIADNAGNADVKDMVDEAVLKGQAERSFFSGDWCIYRIDDTGEDE